MATLSKPPIPLKMYKHFAMATVSLTAGIAMFADSDHRASDTAQSEPQIEQEEARTAHTAPALHTSNIVEAPPVPGSFGDEFIGDYGDPTVTPRTAGSRGWSFHTPRAGSRPPVTGYDQHEIDLMSEEEYREFLASLPPETVESMVGAEERANQIAALERASAYRSGSHTASND